MSTPYSHSPDTDQAAHEESPPPFDSNFFGQYDTMEFNEHNEYNGSNEDNQEDIDEDEKGANNHDSDEDPEQQELENKKEEDALCYLEKDG